MFQQTLTKAKQSPNDFVRSMAGQMYYKFEKYWAEYSLILAIAEILDLRHKIQFVEFCYTKLYGPGSIKSMRVRKKLVTLSIFTRLIGLRNLHHQAILQLCLQLQWKLVPREASHPTLGTAWMY